MNAAVIIRELRKDQGLTMTALSKMSGISLQTICGLEYHRHEPSLVVYELLLDAMGFELVLQKKEVSDEQVD